MKRLELPMILVMLAGCETNETAMTILNVTIPDVDQMTGTCTIEGKADKGHADGLSLDTGTSVSLMAPFSVQNNLAPIDANWSTLEGGRVPVTYRAEITPLRFAARFECDTSAYSGAIVNGLVLPRFNPRESFCVDDRSDARAIDENSDIIPAYGPAIQANSVGIALVRVVPHELGRAVDELFDIAVLADRCCRASDCVGDLSDPDCGALQKIFDAVDGTGALSAAGMAGSQNLTLRRFADYAIFDGNYIGSVEPRFDEKLTTPYFPMYLRGQLEGVTGYGDIVESNDYSLEIDVCRNCGFKTGAMTRGPRGEFGCIRE